MNFSQGWQKNIFCKYVGFIALVLSSGCTSLVVTPLVDPLAQSLQQQTDLELVCDGTPAFLLMIDGFVDSDPDNTRLLTTATQAYAAYTAALTECGKPDRAAQLSDRAKKYGKSLLSELPGFERSVSKPLTDFTRTLTRFDRSDTASLFWGATGWATWVQYQEGSPAALADLPKIEQIMLRVLQLDEGFYNGGAHLFLGAYYASRPKMYGGKPEESQQHFERALQLSKRQFLLTQVTYAETYARMVFDRELYVGLLQEVLNFPLESNPGSALSNLIAKRKARRLLDHVDEYF